MAGQPKSGVSLLTAFGIDWDEAKARHPAEQHPPKRSGKRGFERSLQSPAIELPAIIRYRAKTEEALRARVRRDYKIFARQYLGHDYMPFHVEIMERLWTGGRWVLMLPTEHGKSTLCNVDFPILSLMEDPDAAHILMAVNDTEARRWLKIVRATIEHGHELIRDFPWLKKPPRNAQKPWTTGELTIDGRTDYSNANPSIAARGYGADDVKGRRGKTVGDDLEGKGAVQALERERLYETINTHVIRNIEDPGMGFKRPLLALAGTPFDPASVYFRLTEENGWPYYKQPFIYPDGKLIWPAKQQKIHELSQTLTKTHFSIAMRLDPTAGDDTILTGERIRKLTNAEQSHFIDQVTGRPLEHYTFAFLDPASGSKNKRTDYAGLGVVKMRWVIGEKQPDIELYEPQASTKPIIPQVHEAARLMKAYGCPLILETNGSQWQNYTALIEHFYPELRDQVLRHHTSAEKKYDDTAGMSVIPTLVQQGRLHILTDPEDEGARAFRAEVRDLGTGSNDHIIAGVWFCYRWMWERFRNRRTMTGSESTRRRQPLPRLGTPGYSMRRTLNLGSFAAAARRASEAKEESA